VSATNRGAIRNPNDYYPTPLSAFYPLLPYLMHHTQIWEPASGDGRLIAAMRLEGLSAGGNDLQSGYDFLLDNSRYDTIITNPPFSLALEFAHHALAHADHVYLLLRLNFLASQKRKSWWEQHEPSCLFILSERPSFTGDGTDATDYAWYYWGMFHGNNRRGIVHL